MFDYIIQNEKKSYDIIIKLSLKSLKYLVCPSDYIFGIITTYIYKNKIKNIPIKQQYIF